MRDRPYIAAGESPRPFSEVVAERISYEPDEIARRRAFDEIARLEAEALQAPTAEERKRLQCSAEDLRCALDEMRRS